MVDDGEMLEHARVFGNFYGSPRGPVQAAIEAGATCSSTSTGRARSRSRIRPWAARAVDLHPAALDHRVAPQAGTRGQDSAEVIARRMAKSWDEISHWDGYDYVLVNDDLDETDERLRTIVEAARLRRPQQPGLNEHVRALQREFEEMQ
jgi:guanylate kinase